MRTVTLPLIAVFEPDDYATPGAVVLIPSVVAAKEWSAFLKLDIIVAGRMEVGAEDAETWEGWLKSVGERRIHDLPSWVIAASKREMPELVWMDFPKVVEAAEAVHLRSLALRIQGRHFKVPKGSPFRRRLSPAALAAYGTAQEHRVRTRQQLGKQIATVRALRAYLKEAS